MVEHKEESSELEEFFAGGFVLKAYVDIAAAAPVEAEIVLLQKSNSWVEIEVPSQDQVLSGLESQTVLNEKVSHINVCLLFHTLVLILNAHLDLRCLV